MKISKNKTSSFGFTVIELLVVVAIIGLLVTIILVATRGSTEKAKLAGTIQYSASIRHVLGVDAVGIWSFDGWLGGVNPVKDDSDNNLSGTVLGNPTIADGIVQKAINFDGNDHIRIVSASAFDLTNFTYSVWVKPTALAMSWQTIIDIDDDKQLLGIMDSKVATWGRCNSGALDLLANNRWYHLAWTVSGTSYKLYLDGKQIKDGGSCVASVNGNALNIAAGNPGSGGNEYFIGVIDEVQVYNKSLSDAQIYKIYADSLPAHSVADR